MGSVPGHPILEKIIERAQALVLGKEKLDPFVIVGPAGLGAEANSLLGRDAVPFVPGDYTGTGFTLRILRRRHGALLWLPHRAILDGFRTAVVYKYRGYLHDLKVTGSTHWYFGSRFSGPRVSRPRDSTS